MGGRFTNDQCSLYMDRILDDASEGIREDRDRLLE